MNVHWSLGEKAAISSMDVALAYHCQNQDMILKRVLKPYGENSWEDIKQYGIPLWIKDVKKLRELIEVISKLEFQRSK